MRIAKLINDFNNIMLGKLEANRHKPGWTQETKHDLFKLLQNEMMELEKKLSLDDYNSPEDKTGISKECADIANFAMMIHDNFGENK